jgi:hypothetical protein
MKSKSTIRRRNVKSDKGVTPISFKTAKELKDK